MDHFWTPGPAAEALVCWKDPLIGAWQGRDPVLVWGRGHVCVFPRDADSPRWFPEHLVKQHHGDRIKKPTVKEGKEKPTPDLGSG